MVTPNQELARGVGSQPARHTAAFPCSPTSLPCSCSSRRKCAGQRESAGIGCQVWEGVHNPGREGRGNGWEPTRTRFAALRLCRSAGRATVGLRDVAVNSFFIPLFTLNPLRAIGQHIAI